MTQLPKHENLVQRNDEDVERAQKWYWYDLAVGADDSNSFFKQAGKPKLPAFNEADSMPETKPTQSYGL